MSDRLFEDAVELTLSLEGRGLSTHPDDPGGATVYGISERAHPDAWVGGPPSELEAKDIYRHCYFEDAGVESLPPAVAVAVFDYRVHSGQRGITDLQKMVGAVADGVVGPETLKCLAAYAEFAVARDLTEARRGFLRDLTANSHTFRRWARGWNARCDRVIEYAKRVSIRSLQGQYVKKEAGRWSVPKTARKKTTKKKEAEQA